MRKLSFIIVILLFSGKLSAQTSPHGKIEYDCSDCHVSTSWKDIPSQKKFKHEATKFALVGQHKNVDCKQCHSTLKFAEAKEECASCHKDIHRNTVSNQCSNCHSPSTWLIKNITDIHQRSRFPLLGQHAKADCQQCHSLYSELNFEPLGVRCYDCHKQNYAATQNPNHAQAGFSTNCESCHDFTDALWGYASFAHDFFPLQGGHKIANCFNCHKQGSFTGLSKDCYSCHQRHYDETKDPDHLALKFSTDCTECHTINSWKPSTFDHAKTGFALVGAHTSLNCNKCHESGFKGTPTDCYSCHKVIFEAATDPNHIASQFPTDCTQCHSTSAWKPATFDHSTTQFPLTGAHLSVACNQCHTSGYVNTPKDCYSCHKTDYDNTANPKHSTAGFPTTCLDCHKTTTWTGATFDHKYFPIASGKHSGINCTTCHNNSSNYANFTCLSSGCHEKSKTDSKHIGEVNGYSYVSSECYRCHPTGRGEGAFNHSSSRLPLTGIHLTITCESCHLPSNTSPLSPDCSSCHQSSVVNSDSPNHQQLGLSSDCKSCHTSDGWKPSSFNHAVTNFQLIGGHTKAVCSDCHKGKTTGTSQVCNDCHQQSFVNAQNPNHQALGLSTDCKTCHTPSAWIPSSFNHAATNFQLTGGHTKAACSDCHKGKTTGTDTQCYACHKTNYDGAKNPDHLSAKFSTDCTSCHVTSVWTPSTFNHSTTKFLLTGAHTSVDCAKCHASGYINTPTDCYSCHKTKYDATTNPKHSTAGFLTSCQDCHKTTAWTPATFDHDKYFPIASGKHSGNSCATCHNSSNYANFTCLSSGCHDKSKTDSKHIGEVNGYSYVSSECYRCHPRGKESQIRNFIKTLEN